MERKTFSIVREGKTYKLTLKELHEAYFVQQRNFDVDDIVSIADEQSMRDLFPDATDKECGIIVEALKDESIVQQIANDYAKRKDDDDSWYYLLQAAVKEVVGNLLDKR